MDAYATLYIGAVVEFNDFFTMHEECSNCNHKINNRCRKVCPKCKAKLTGVESKNQFWTPMAPELLCLLDKTPLDEDGWDEYVLSVDWAPELNGEIELFRATFSSGAPLLLGLELTCTDLCAGYGEIDPHRTSLAQLTEAFAKVRAALEKYSLGDRPVEQWGGGFVS